MKFSVSIKCSSRGKTIYNDSIFEFNLNDPKFLKMLHDSHSKMGKIVRGALCKKFLEEASFIAGKKLTLKEAYATCQRIG